MQQGTTLNANARMLNLLICIQIGDVLQKLTTCCMQLCWQHCFSDTHSDRDASHCGSYQDSQLAPEPHRSSYYWVVQFSVHHVQPVQNTARKQRTNLWIGQASALAVKLPTMVIASQVAILNASF